MQDRFIVNIKSICSFSCVAVAYTDEQYPEFDKQPCIKIFFSKKCPDVVDRYLNKLKKYYNELQCDLVWIYDPQED